MVTKEQRTEIYFAQCKNVNALSRAWDAHVRHLNRLCRINDFVGVSTNTPILGFLFSALAEARFLKAIHTPYGFDLIQIGQILQVQEFNGLSESWKTAIALGLEEVQKRPRSNLIPNIRQKLDRLVTDVILKPAEIRNKLAHGQWIVALNRDKSSINKEITSRLAQLDYVRIMVLNGSHERLAAILESLIESPDRHFHREYWNQITELEGYLQTTANWSLQTKIQKLIVKPVETAKP